MPLNASIRRSLPQALESLKHGTGASTHLPASVRAVSIQYTYKRAGKSVEEFITKIAPRLSYANPLINITTSHRPTPHTKSKDPALQARAAESAEEIKTTGGDPQMTVEFHDAQSQTISIPRGMETSRILSELVALAEGRSTLTQEA